MHLHVEIQATNQFLHAPATTETMHPVCTVWAIFFSAFSTIWGKTMAIPFHTLLLWGYSIAMITASVCQSLPMCLKRLGPCLPWIVEILKTWVHWVEPKGFWYPHHPGCHRNGFGFAKQRQGSLFSRFFKAKLNAWRMTILYQHNVEIDQLNTPVQELIIWTIMGIHHRNWRL